MNDPIFTLENGGAEGGWLLCRNGVPIRKCRDQIEGQGALLDAITHLAEQRPAKVEAA